MLTTRQLRSLSLALLVCGSGLRAGLGEPASRQLVLQAPPATSVHSVDVSPDGSLVVTAAGEGGLRLYDAATGRLLRVIGALGDRCAIFSPDGRTLAAAGFHMDKLVKTVEVATGKIVRSFAGHSQIETNAVAFSPDGKLLASACRDNEILVWDVATGALRHRLEGAPAVALAFSPDSGTLATGGADRTVRLWSAATGKLERSVPGHRDCVVTLAFAPDGRTLASGSCDWASHRGRNTREFGWFVPPCVSEWKLWDVASGEIERTVEAPGRLLSLAFSPDGRSLAGAIAEEIRLYDLGAADDAGRVLARHHFDATSVAFTPDGGAILSAGHDQAVKRIDVAAAEITWEASGYCEQVNSVALSTDGALLVTGSSDRRFAVRTLRAGHEALRPGATRLWDARTGRLLRRLGDMRGQVMAVAVSPDGKQVASAGAATSGAGVTHLFDAATGALIWSVDDHAAEVLALGFTADGSALATGSADGFVKLRDPRTGAVLHALPRHRGGATAIAFPADGATLVCGQGEGGALVWDTRTWRLRKTLKAADSRAAGVTTDRLFTAIALTPDGASFWECVASVGNTYSEPARLWDIASGETKRETAAGRPVALSPDGAIVALGGKTISLRDAVTGEELRRLTGHLKKVQSIAFSADGRRIFAGGSWGTTNVWKVASGRHLLTLFAFSEGGDGTLSDDWLAYRSDATYDGSARVERYLAWRVGDELETPPPPSGSVLHGALNPKGEASSRSSPRP